MENSRQNRMILHGRNKIFAIEYLRGVILNFGLSRFFTSTKFRKIISINGAPSKFGSFKGGRGMVGGSVALVDYFLDADVCKLLIREPYLTVDEVDGPIELFDGDVYYQIMADGLSRQELIEVVNGNLVSWFFFAVAVLRTGRKVFVFGAYDGEGFLVVEK